MWSIVAASRPGLSLPRCKLLGSAFSFTAASGSFRAPPATPSPRSELRKISRPVNGYPLLSKGRKADLLLPALTAAFRPGIPPAASPIRFMSLTQTSSLVYDPFPKDI